MPLVVSTTTFGLPLLIEAAVTVKPLLNENCSLLTDFGAEDSVTSTVLELITMTPVTAGAVSLLPSVVPVPVDSPLDSNVCAALI